MKKVGFLLLLLLTGCESLDTVKRFHADLGVREKVGVLAHLDVAWPNSTGPLARALAHFRAEGVDKVVILGDPTKNGYANQHQVFENAWRKAFAGTTPPERIMASNEYVLAGITFTDEGRFPLTDLLCVHPKNGRRINAGSMHGIKVSGIFTRQDAKATAASDSSAQGLLVLVRDDGLEVRRLDFSGAAAEEVGPPWRVDSEGMIHSAIDDVPKFWDDTVIGVIAGYDGKGQKQYTLRWPPVLAKHTGARAFSYDVSVGDKVIRQVQSAGFFLPEDRDGAAVRCVILASELGGREPRFGVTPVSSLGKNGPTVWSK